MVVIAIMIKKLGMGVEINITKKNSSNAQNNMYLMCILTVALIFGNISFINQEKMSHINVK